FASPKTAKNLDDQRDKYRNDTGSPRKRSCIRHASREEYQSGYEPHHGNEKQCRLQAIKVQREHGFLSAPLGAVWRMVKHACSAQSPFFIVKLPGNNCPPIAERTLSPAPAGIFLFS